MKPVQFNPSPEDVLLIKTRNASLPENERICFKCGHIACFCCITWCDTMLHNLSMQGNWEELDTDDIKANGDVFPPHPCCNGSCEYI